MTKLGVLMVTGAYLPELSGGGLQCRTMIQALGDKIEFRVLTTCTDPALPREALVEGTVVTRLLVDVGRPITKVRAAFRTIAFFAAHSGSFQLVHLHGFSQKSVLIALLARLFSKKLLITIHTAGQDEPDGIRKLGRLAYSCYSGADRFIAISERVAGNYRAAGLPTERLSFAPNGVDTERFRPADSAQRLAARQEIGGLPISARWIVFVGFFSHDKSPDVLFEAWLRLRSAEVGETGLLFVGATQSPYHEVDSGLAQRIRHRAEEMGVGHLVHFAGEIRHVERAYQAADVFVMPSAREAFGMALVEAMASGLPVVASRIAGVSDTIINDGMTGVLVEPRDPSALASGLRGLLVDEVLAAQMGRQARASVIERYAMAPSAGRWLEIYRQTMGGSALVP